MSTLLDLDLRFFSWPPVSWPHPNLRPPDEYYACAPVEEVQQFLESQCGLNAVSRLPGNEFEDHGQAFCTWRRWIEEGVVESPFRVVKADIRIGIPSEDEQYLYLLTELMALPVEQRRSPCEGHNGLNADDYLMFAIGNRWLSHLTHIRPSWAELHPDSTPIPSRPSTPRSPEDGAADDQMVLSLQGEVFNNGVVELKHFTADALDRWIESGQRLTPEPLPEPAVAIDVIPCADFRCREFTHMVVARSPQHTPPSADRILPVIRRYFKPM